MTQQIDTLTAQSDLSSWLDYVAGIHVSAIDMGLERVLPIAEHLGVLKAQQAKTPYVFMVAGTNGKGSTTATIAKICQTSGYKTALYQSPHLISFTERISIGGTYVSEQELVSALFEVEQARIACGLTLSFFEMTTLAAFLLFKKADCDVWVLEIGLGGRLDVVNIIDPDVAVITNIGIDHIDWLGDDIEKIGQEKAGIIRDGIKVVLGSQSLPQSVYDAAASHQAACWQFTKDFYFQELGERWQYSAASMTLDLPKPKLSLLNAANAVTAVLASDLAISHQHIATGLEQVHLPGRFDYRRINDRHWLFDVAHNSHGMQFLLQQLVPFWQAYQQKNPAAKMHILFSMLGDKDMRSVLQLVASASNQGRIDISSWYMAPIDNPRASSLDEIQQLVSQELPNVNQHSHDSLQVATLEVIKHSSDKDLIVVFGSFHTVSETLITLLGKPY